MEVFKREKYFGSIEFRLSQRELPTLDVKHKIPATHIFHHEVYACFRLKTGVKAQQKRMSLAGRGEKDTLLGLCATPYQ